MTTFPSSAVLGTKVEILLNGTWTDITTYCYSRNPVTITGGRQDEAATLNPTQATITLNNRDGRFSPSNSAGAYFPFLVRNAQLRISVSSTSSASVTYSGYRFWGEVSSWPPQSDPSATDIYVDVVASGVWRRLQQGTAATIGTPVYRYYSTLPSASQPVVYWPCEDGSTATSFASGVSAGGAMTWTGTPGLGADSTSFKGANALPQLNGSAWTGPPGGSGLVASPAVYSTAGAFSWLCPGDVTSLTSAEAWGSGAGGTAASAGAGGTGGGGGEYRKITSVAVTPGTVYTFTVPAGGAPGADGTAASFSGDAATVTANGATGSTGGSGGSGTTGHNGGNGAGNGSSPQGGGGGGSGGTGSAGNNGTDGASGGAGASAVTGGGPGGQGGKNFGGSVTGAAPGSGPGGGGGGGAAASHGGGGGYAGQVKLTYSSSLAPAANVLRFLLSVPSTGGTNGAVLARLSTGGTVATMDVTYGTGGTLKITGKNGGGGTLFTSTSGAIANGVPMMVSCELTTSGANVNWAFKYIKPGDTSATSIASGTVTTATTGLMSGNLLVNVSGTETKAVTVGHVTFQYALNSLDGLGVVIGGHDGEYAADRFTRLCTESGLSYTLLSQVYDNLTLLDTPLAWWKLNDLAGLTTAADSSGNGHTGTATSVTFGSTNEAVPGNTSASFSSGSTSHITSLYSPALAAVTVEAWVNLNSLSQAGNPVLMANSNTSSDHKGFVLDLSGTTPRVTFGNNVSSLSITAGSPLPASGWTYVAGKWDGTTVTLYVNGVSQGTGGLSGTMPAGLGNIGLGFNPIGSPNYLNGLLAECAVYGTALSSGDISARYTAASAPSSNSAQMGPQADDTLGNLFQSVEDADRGLLFEPRDRLGLGYRTRENMQNQAPVATLDYASFHLSPPLIPAADDQLIRNDATVTRNNGSSARYALTSGAMSTANPPSGVGDYSYTPTVNVHADSQLAAMALWIVTVGTATDYRYPQVNVELARSAVASLFAAVPLLGPGDYLQITTPPSWLTASTVKQLAYGFHETLSQYQWSFQFNTVAEAPWEGAGLPSW